jgi:hypothetical protein
VLGVVHFQDAAAHRADAAGRGDRNSFVATAFAVQVVVVGDSRTTGELEDLVAAGRYPMAAVGLGPGHRARGLHLLGDGFELRPVPGAVPIEVVLVLLAISVADGVIDTHSFVSLDVSSVGTPCRLRRRR